MKFVQGVLWIGTAAVFIFSTSIFGATALKCEYGGSCYFVDTFIDGIIKFETKNCSDSCVYFKCFVGDYKVMEGAGCFEEFVNTCKFVDTQLLKEIKSNYQNYTYNSQNYTTKGRSLVLASCNRRDGCAKEMFYKMVPYNHRLFDFGFDFHPKYALKNYTRHPTCEYDNTPKQKLSNVKCETKGWCKSGGRFKYDFLEDEVDPGMRRIQPLFCGDCAKHDLMNHTYCERRLFETKICDSCSKFLCTFDGKEIISGHGCFEDFERMCNVVMNETVKSEIDANRKNYFYSDQNVLMVTCSDSDNCQFDAFKNYYDVNFDRDREPPLLRLERYGKCNYEPIVIPPTTTTMTTTTVSTTTQSTTTSNAAITTSTATAQLVSFESTSQQKEEANINNSSVLFYASFYLLFLMLLIVFFVIT